MSIQRYDCGPANELDEVEDGNYVNYWDHLNKMTDTFAAKMRLAQQVDDHKAALAEQVAELEKARELLRRGRIAAQFMANEELDRDIASYLGDKA